MKKQMLSRRRMLKGMGAVMGLPLLEAMAPFKLLSEASSAAGSSIRPIRMAILYMANGVNPHHWTPKGADRDFELSQSLQPLAGLKDQLLVFTELWNAASNTGDGHYVKTGGFLTGTTITRTTGSNLCSGGISCDQVVARKLGNLTALPSLELGIEPVRGGVDTNVGFTQLYGGHISWSTPTTPLSKEINPQLAFDRLFRPANQRRSGEIRSDKSVLDLVSEDARRLRSKLGADDQRKLDEYFESVRAVERRIEFDARRQAEQVQMDPLARKEMESLGNRIKDYYADPERRGERRGNHTEQVKLMLDIIALAFWTDSTRVATFMFGNAVSGRNFSFLDGVRGSHHEMSHHENDAEKLKQYQIINQWHVEQYAYLLKKLQSIKEGQGTVLDNSMIMFGAGMRDGNAHNPRNLPVILAGRAGGTLATGRHLVYEKNTPLCNLYRSMLSRMGTPVEKFGDSTSELPGLDDATWRSPGVAAA